MSQEKALQIALGNMDVNSGKEVHAFDPDTFQVIIINLYTVKKMIASLRINVIFHKNIHFLFHMSIVRITHALTHTDRLKIMKILKVKFQEYSLCVQRQQSRTLQSKKDPC